MTSHPVLSSFFRKEPLDLEDEVAVLEALQKQIVPGLDWFGLPTIGSFKLGDTLQSNTKDPEPNLLWTYGHYHPSLVDDTQEGMGLRLVVDPTATWRTVYPITSDNHMEKVVWGMTHKGKFVLVKLKIKLLVRDSFKVERIGIKYTNARTLLSADSAYHFELKEFVETFTILARSWLEKQQSRYKSAELLHAAVAGIAEPFTAFEKHIQEKTG